MKVNNDNNISFNGLYNKKFLKKGLEFAADNGALFAATTTLILSSAVRPLAILATPKTDKKNKQVACAKSISSTINGYLMTLALSLPLARSIKQINKNPQNFLKKKTINNLKENAETITDSKAYKMATQLFKLGLGFVIAAPKAVLTAIGTPYILKYFEKNSKDIETKENTDITNNISFKGKGGLARNIGKIIDSPSLQDFVKKNKDSNFPLHIIAATDTLATVTFVQQTTKNNKLHENEKKPLIYNSILSTALSIISTYVIDKLTNKSTDRFIEKLKQENQNDPKISKYIEGTKIAKPILIAGCIYYIFIPIIATFVSDRLDKLKN